MQTQRILGGSNVFYVQGRIEGEIGENAVVLHDLAEEKLEELTGSDDIGILEIPLKLFNPYRILALKILYLHGDADFRELKSDLKATDGNLASHLRALEEDGYIEGYKRIKNRRPRTTYHLTKRGIDEFVRFLTYLRRVVQDERKT